MKKTTYISAAIRPYNTTYKVRWISPDGQDCLLGGSNTLEHAVDIGVEQAQELLENPFETDERKLLFLENMYIEDTRTGEAIVTELDDFVDGMMSEIDTRIQMRNRN